MEYEWDELKNRRNIEKHNISFKEASQMFDRPMFSNLDQREDYGEDRWIGLGLLRSGKVAVVAFTDRSDDVIRIISTRKATQYESEAYHNHIGY